MKQVDKEIELEGECEGCDEYDCQDCCMHDSGFDHSICVDCGIEMDGGWYADSDSWDMER
jgi:hypothetical protein